MQQSDDEVELDEITDVDASEEELKATDTVSINSDTEPESDLLIPVNQDSAQHDQPKVNTTETIVEGEQIEGSNGETKEASTLEIHEIDSGNEDCTEIQEVKPQTQEDPVPLRRSSRAIKRKRYTDDLENVDDYEAGIEDSLRHKVRPIVSNNNKIMIEMTAKNMRFNQFSKNKRDSTVVVLESYSKRYPPKKMSENSIYFNQNSHYLQRNTNAIANKCNTVSNNLSQTPSILPSLTDDMYVVEAPSFIVPYVYEKPSMIAFRDFVQTLGKELEEQRVKEKELSDKEKDSENDDKNDKVSQGQNVESVDEESCKKKKKEAKKGKCN